jgi:ribosome-associated protein
MLIEIPENEIELSAARSGGPGGQSVNKTSSKIVLKWSVKDSVVLSEDEKNLLRQKLSSRINSDDMLVVHAQESRSQNQNRQTSLSRLNDLINSALDVPEERKPTRLPRHKKEKRLEIKKQHSQKKALRKKPNQNE